MVSGIPRIGVLERSLETVKASPVLADLPVMIFHEDYVHEDKERLHRVLPQVEFHEVDFSGFDDVFVDHRKTGKGYMMMCRFWSGIVQAHPALAPYTHYIRLDDDSFFLRPHVTREALDRMLDSDYAYRQTFVDASVQHENLYKFTIEWMKRVGLSGARSALVDDGKYNGWSVYNNFHCSSLALWRHPVVKSYVQAIEDARGCLARGWMDAAIHTMIVTLIAPVVGLKIVEETSFGYRHNFHRAIIGDLGYEYDGSLPFCAEPREYEEQMDLEAVVSRVRSAGGPTLVVDDGEVAQTLAGEKGVLLLSKTKRTPEELWSLPGAGKIEVVVISAKREPGKLFQVLSLVDRLVVRDGVIFVLGQSNAAIDSFCEVSDWWPASQKGLVALQRNRYLSAEEIIAVSHQAKRVVSLSIFNDHRFGAEFWRKMPEYVTNFVLAHHALFPGWELWIHHDEHLFHSNAGDVLCGLERRGLVKLVYMPSRPEQGKCERMLHRLAPAWDPDVAYVACRDVDAIPTWRDRQAVEEFIASGRTLGTIHDSIAHGKIMGGLCHVNARELRRAKRTFEQFVAAAEFSDERWNEHGADQEYLAAILPVWFPNVLEHSLFVAEGEGGVRVKPLPSWSGSEMRYDLGQPTPEVVESVSEFVRAGSDGLINYMGASSYPTKAARDFYDHHSPVGAIVREVEHMASVGVKCDRAVLGCDLNPDYSFYLPLCTLFWAMRGYRPLILLVSTPEAWLSDPKHRLEVVRARELGAEIYWLGDFEGVRTSTVAQVSRIFGALAPGIADDDYLVTADVDMLPIGEWVGSERNAAQDFTIWFANAYAEEVAKTGVPHWPMNYVGAKAKAWREVFVTTGTPTLQERLRVILDYAPKESSEAWGYDEMYMSARLAECPAGLSLIPRTFVEGEWRIDRSDWDAAVTEAVKRGNLDGVADAHIIRPGYTSENWFKLTPLLRIVLAEEQFRWVFNYWNEFNA